MITKRKYVTVPVNRRALKLRVAKALAPKGLRLVASLGSTREEALGKYYVLDIERGVVVREHLDLEDYAREVGVLQPYESLAPQS